jgi:hypothetical protein
LEEGDSVASSDITYINVRLFPSHLMGKVRVAGEMTAGFYGLIPPPPNPLPPGEGEILVVFCQLFLGHHSKTYFKIGLFCHPERSEGSQGIENTRFFSTLRMTIS